MWRLALEALESDLEALAVVRPLEASQGLERPLKGLGGFWRGVSSPEAEGSDKLWTPFGGLSVQSLKP